MANPTFRGRLLWDPQQTGESYCGHIRGAYVNVWQFDCGDQKDMWRASANVAGSHFVADIKPTASLALRSLLAELNRVHRKLGKLLEPVAKRKKAGRK
jgi:hypothetical protein